jgi:hypothetical protein
MALSRAAIVESAASAFAAVPLPTPPLTPCSCDECAAIAAFLHGRTRATLSLADAAIFGSTNLHLVSLPAIQYYFPILVEKALAPGEADFLDSLLYFLSYTFEYDPARLERFTAAQRRSIVDMLEYFEEAYLADRLPLGDPYQVDLALRIWREAAQPSP